MHRINSLVEHENISVYIISSCNSLMWKRTCQWDSRSTQTKVQIRFVSTYQTATNRHGPSLIKNVSQYRAQAKFYTDSSPIIDLYFNSSPNVAPMSIPELNFSLESNFRLGWFQLIERSNLNSARNNNIKQVSLN